MTTLEELERHVRSIRRGELKSYGWLASKLGHKPGGARAAGQKIAKATEALLAARPNELFPPDFPWWRVVGASGEIAAEAAGEGRGRRQADQLRREGFEIVATGKRTRVRRLPDGFE